MSPSSFEYAIVGGGPAGAALAWLLARDGRSVLLVDDASRRGGAPRETLLGTARAGLERSELGELVREAAAPDVRRHGAVWGAATLLWREDPEPGHVLERGAFDAELQRQAAAAGARVMAGARVLTTGSGLSIRGVDGCSTEIAAGRVVLATGRRDTHLAPLLTIERGVETFALSLEGHCPEASRLAIVEAVPQGWWWWIGDLRQGGSATLIGDAEELAAIGTRAMVARAREAALGPVRELRQLRIRQATRATARHVRTDADMLLIGDAATTIDPLASQGVEKALAAADHAAAVLRAAAQQPDWWPRLRRLHADWERDLFLAHARTTAAFLGREQRFVGQPFWSRRHLAAPPARVSPAADSVLCRRQGLRDGAVLERHGDTFREVDGIECETSGATLAHVGYVPVAPVLRAFAAPVRLSDGVRACGDDPRLYVLPPDAVESAAVELSRRGWLTSGGTATDR